MQTSAIPRPGSTAVLRRRPVLIVAGQPAGGYTDVFEVICRACGDDPHLGYREIPAQLQQVRGPYPMAAGVTAYIQHIEQHPG